MRQSSYSYKVHTQKKEYLENLFIIGDRKQGRRGMELLCYRKRHGNSIPVPLRLKLFQNLEKKRKCILNYCQVLVVLVSKYQQLQCVSTYKTPTKTQVFRCKCFSQQHLQTFTVNPLLHYQHVQCLVLTVSPGTRTYHLCIDTNTTPILQSINQSITLMSPAGNTASP